MFLKFAFLLVLGVAFEKVYADDPESIVGGTDASPGEFPYQVSLQKYGQHFCGGTIVSSTQIVTAAHCIEGVVSAPWSGFTVVSGSVTLSPAGQSHSVKNVRVHPGYKAGSKYAWVNDAALVYLEQPITFNAYQKPIPMAKTDPPVNAPLQLSGWGKTSFLGGIPNTLQKTTVYPISNKECADVFRGVPIRSTHMCTFTSRGIGACHGDSGGPLVYQGQLVGITSWVAPCARGLPDAFTRVSQYADFFHDVPSL